MFRLTQARNLFDTQKNRQEPLPENHLVRAPVDRMVPWVACPGVSPLYSLTGGVLSTTSGLLQGV